MPTAEASFRRRAASTPPSTQAPRQKQRVQQENRALDVDLAPLVLYQPPSSEMSPESEAAGDTFRAEVRFNMNLPALLWEEAGEEEHIGQLVVGRQPEHEDREEGPPPPPYTEDAE